MLKVFGVNDSRLVLGTFLALADDTAIGLVVEHFTFAGLTDAEVALVEVEATCAKGVVLEVEYPLGIEGLVEETAFEVQVGTC